MANRRGSSIFDLGAFPDEAAVQVTLNNTKQTNTVGEEGIPVVNGHG